MKWKALTSNEKGRYEDKLKGDKSQKLLERMSREEGQSGGGRGSASLASGVFMPQQILQTAVHFICSDH